MCYHGIQNEYSYFNQIFFFFAFSKIYLLFVTPSFIKQLLFPKFNCFLLPLHLKTIAFFTNCLYTPKSGLSVPLHFNHLDLDSRITNTGELLNTRQLHFNFLHAALSIMLAFNLPKKEYIGEKIFRFSAKNTYSFFPCQKLFNVETM